MTISVLIPWRTDHGHRERLWTYLRPRWEQLDVELCVATDGAEDGAPFSYATAANRAAEQAAGDVLVTWGADQLPDAAAIADAAAVARERHWSMVFEYNGTFSPFDTERILAGADPASLRPETFEAHCTGIIAVRRDAWDELGGMDERFVGWGYEDAALRDQLISQYGTPRVRDRTLLCLWHPTRHRVYTGPNADLYYREYAPRAHGA